MSSNVFAKHAARAGFALTALAAPAIAWAQEAAPEVAAAAAPIPDKGDTAFMFLCTILVLFMLVPGLGLFYGGLMRAKNMLSVLMQCTVIGAADHDHLGGLRLLVRLRRLGQPLSAAVSPRSS